MQHNIFEILETWGIALAIIAGTVLVICFIWKIFRHINRKLEHAHGRERVKPLTIKHIRLLTAKQFLKVIQVFLGLLKLAVTFVLLFLAVPFVLKLFPATENIAGIIFGYILTPLRNFALSTIRYIPNFITIVIIITITRYVIKALKFFEGRIEKGVLEIPGFYADWAHPTSKILQVLLWAFTLVVIFPYLPGSDSRIFQGVTVFLGVLFSIGSTSSIGNLVAGFVITYMRPFKIGDRVKIEDTTGFVVEKNVMIVRLKTDKNEYVTFPNIKILGDSITNYSTSSDEGEDGLVVYTEVTVDYSVPWPDVHEILIKAALAVDYVQKTPKPYVLQTKLDDYYVCYQINCYTKEISKIPVIQSKLHENIQNGFRDAGIDMTTYLYEKVNDEG